jgi:hypothetical protein
MNNPSFFQYLISFSGFCILLAVSYFLKKRLIRSIPEKDYFEDSKLPIIGDVFIIALTFLYTVWLYRYLYQ